MVWQSLVYVALAGAIGGLIAWLAPGGPRRKEKGSPGPQEPGFIQALVVGGFAAAVSWALTDPIAAVHLVDDRPDLVPTIGQLLAGSAVGLAGSKWLGNHYKADLYKFVGSIAASSSPSSEAAAALANGQARKALEALRP